MNFKERSDSDGSIFHSVKNKFLRFVRGAAPTTKLGSSMLWLAVITVGLGLLTLLPGAIGDIFASLASLTFLAVIFGSIPLLLRWLRWHMLWKLRNRLRVTYLLIGLAPVVLFGTLAAVAAYVFSGQFANFAATAEISAQLEKLSAGNQAFTAQVAHMVADHGGSLSTLSLSELPFSTSDMSAQGNSLQLGAFVDGKRIPLSSLPETMQMETMQPPAWIQSNFRGLVLDHDQLFFRAIDSKPSGAHSVVTIASIPMNSTFLERVARGLGKITLMQDTRLNAADVATSPAVNADVPVESEKSPQLSTERRRGRPTAQRNLTMKTISGGTLAKRVNLLDIPIDIPTFLDVTRWRTGNQFAVVALVTSRPSLLYQRLFRQSIRMGSALQIALLIAGVIFGVLQLLALWMASRLSRTITQSISDLYQATRAVDEGKLDHRIQVTRNDQLAELAQSFNRMSASLARLLLEQHEKERMQSELAIAQEVQANLFPNMNIALPKLEMYGICRPARTVSGDYYDFLLFGESSVGLAIGDISGKGISAALLMATLHSAMRAYRFCSEEPIQNPGTIPDYRGLEIDGQNWHVLSDLFQSPGKILSLLNRQLYLSTQTEKYATLFLAHYDAQNNGLRYSNGGHLPPLILRANGRVERLDCGGTVIGLLEGMSYEEGSVQLEPGDLFIGYTDGVTEPENEFGEFGEARMMEVIRQNRHLSLKEICDLLIQTLDDWIGAAEQPDDITLVLARQR